MLADTNAVERRREAEHQTAPNDGSREREHVPVDPASSSAATSAGKNDGRTSAVQSATIKPSAPPAHRGQGFRSASGAAATRPAPSASRTAISRPRAVARETSRPATLAQAISSTSVTAVIRTPPTITTSPRNRGWMRACGRTTASGTGRWVRACRDCSAGTRRQPSRDGVNLRLRLARLDPARSRPTTDNPRLPRLARSATGGGGVHKSMRAPRFEP